MRASRSCVFAAMVTAVGIAISPAAGLAVADPTDPLIPVPQPSPADSVPISPPVQEIPSGSPVQIPEIPQEQSIPQQQVINPEPVTIPDSPQLPPVADVPTEQPVVPQAEPPAMPEVPQPEVVLELPTQSSEESEQLPADTKPEVPVIQSVPEESEAPSGAIESEPPTDQSVPDESDVPTGVPNTNTGIESPSLPPDPDKDAMMVPEPSLPSEDESVPSEEDPTLGVPDTQKAAILEEPVPPAPEEMRVLSELEKKPPIEAAVYDINGPQDHGYRHGDHDWNKGNKHDDSWDDKQWPRWPVPGRDKVDHDWDHRDRDHKGPPRDHGIKWQKDRDGRPVIINYTKEIVYVNITNINVVNNVNTAVKVVPVYPGRPVYLGHDWCGGASGTFGWSANFGVASHGASARFAGGGAFSVSHGCGVYLPPQVHQLPYVKIVAEHYPRPVYARSAYYDACSCLVVNNNTFLYGKWQGKPYHSAFVPRSYRTDVVFQPQPIQGVPRWLFDTGVNPTDQTAGVIEEMRKWAPLLLLLGGILLAVGARTAFWSRQPDGGDGA